MRLQGMGLRHSPHFNHGDTKALSWVIHSDRIQSKSWGRRPRGGTRTPGPTSVVGSWSWCPARGLWTSFTSSVSLFPDGCKLCWWGFICCLQRLPIENTDSDPSPPWPKTLPYNLLLRAPYGIRQRLGFHLKSYPHFTSFLSLSRSQIPCQCLLGAPPPTWTLGRTGCAAERA